MKKYNYLKVLSLLVVTTITLVGCGQNASTSEESSEVQENGTLQEEAEGDDELEKNDYTIISVTDFENGIAFVTEKDWINGDTRMVAIDVEGNEMFVLPETEDNTIYQPNVDVNGEYIWYEGLALNRSGETICDITDKYRYTSLGNGYVMVKEIASGYEQKTEKMGVIDGHGNEIIPVSEEFSELCGGELLNRGSEGDYYGEGIGFDRQEKVMIDANQGVYYKINGDIKEYKNGNVLVYGGGVYRSQGTTMIEYGRNIELTLLEDKVVGLDKSDSEGVWIRTYDLEGNVINETMLSNIILENAELKYDNGSSALYIHGADGYYVTMIDEYGNFKFEPVKHENHITDDTNFMWSEVSEGLLRVALDESTTIFIDEEGKEVLRIPYNIECVGNCKNGRIAVNTGENGFYVDAKTGEYIEKM